MFYIPHWLWKIYEDGRLQKITSGLQGRTLDIETRKGQLEDLVKYVKGKKISNSNIFFHRLKMRKKNSIKKVTSNFAHLFWKVRSKCDIIFALKGIVSIHISIIWWTRGFSLIFCDVFLQNQKNRRIFVFWKKMGLKSIEYDNWDMIQILYQIFDSAKIIKGGLISELFFIWLKSPKMGAKSRPWASFL